MKHTVNPVQYVMHLGSKHMYASFHVDMSIQMEKIQEYFQVDLSIWKAKTAFFFFKNIVKSLALPIGVQPNFNTPHLYFSAFQMMRQSGFPPVI